MMFNDYPTRENSQLPHSLTNPVLPALGVLDPAAFPGFYQVERDALVVCQVVVALAAGVSLVAEVSPAAVAAYPVEPLAAVLVVLVAVVQVLLVDPVVKMVYLVAPVDLVYPVVPVPAALKAVVEVFLADPAFAVPVNPVVRLLMLVPGVFCPFDGFAGVFFSFQPFPGFLE